MTNLELSHPGAMELIDSGVIAVARSLIPGSLCAVDKTMEETFMKFAKSSGKSEEHDYDMSSFTCNMQSFVMNKQSSPV